MPNHCFLKGHQKGLKCVVGVHGSKIREADIQIKARAPMPSKIRVSRAILHKPRVTSRALVDGDEN